MVATHLRRPSESRLWKKLCAAIWSARDSSGEYDLLRARHLFCQYLLKRRGRSVRGQWARQHQQTSCGRATGLMLTESKRPAPPQPELFRPLTRTIPTAAAQATSIEASASASDRWEKWQQGYRRLYLASGLSAKFSYCACASLRCRDDTTHTPMATNPVSSRLPSATRKKPGTRPGFPSI